MNRKISADEFRASVERQLSGLKPDPWLAQHIEASDKEGKPVKKFSATFILVAAIICISVTALAAGLIFSPTYDAVRIANHVMEEKYGITPELLCLFSRKVAKNEDGTSVVTFRAGDNIRLYPDRIGIYRIVINGSDVSSSWSYEGKDTSGGLAAEAYGPDQLLAFSRNYENTIQQLIDLRIIPHYDTPDDPEPEDEDIPVWTDEDQAQWEQEYAEELAAAKQLLVETVEAESRGKITADQIIETAKKAIIQEYSLTKEQSEKLDFVPDYTSYPYRTNQDVTNQDDEPLVKLGFFLWQNEGTDLTGEYFTENDGYYWVTINMKTGVIEDLLYDAGIAGNG